MPFSAHSRFQKLRTLGEGGMGIVYEAYDRVRKRRIALKKLRDSSAEGLFRFKREFRALRDISHPNIINMYELIAEKGDWYLTMEVVDGMHFVAALRSDSNTSNLSHARDPSTVACAAVSATTGVTAPLTAHPGDIMSGLPVPPDVRPALTEIVDIDRMLDMFRQLARALTVLHSVDIVHRDLKPSNVLITGTDRVVLMDFGIVARADRPREAVDDGLAVGTPTFMAPEQALGLPPTPAADWYAFGVMLYAVLTGTLPFVGRESIVLDAKQNTVPLAPSRFTDGIPRELEALCMQLLSHVVNYRPNGTRVLECLRVDTSETEALIDASSVTRSGEHFVGRARELATLDAEMRAVAAGASRCALVVGPMGMGKTSLLDRFLRDEQASAEPPLVLSGRCHEREILHYKALDSIVDQLSSHLAACTDAFVREVLPDDLGPLLQVFPVLRRLPACRARHVPTGAPQSVRERAERGLRDLLGALARIRPIVLVIEDLHWADADSLDMLLAVLRGPVPGGLLFLMTLCRESMPPDRDMARRFEQIELLDICTRMQLGPLSSDEQHELSIAMESERGPLERTHRRAWSESGGHPMLLVELARYASQSSSVFASGDNVQLEDVICGRVDGLPESARLLLYLIAVAGEPMPMQLLADVGTLSLADVERGCALLRVNHLARISRSGDEPWLDVYHEKVRHAVIDQLSDSRVQALHEQLAYALERWRRPSAALMARQWLLAGHRTRAARYLFQAAREAADNLAFERAAQLHSRAVELARPLVTTKVRTRKG